MNYNFTDRVRKVLAMAREEAVRLQHDYVGTEHILLGLIAAMGLNTWRDTVISVFALITYATPLFWVGLMLIVVFSLNLGWFPTSGMEYFAMFYEGWDRVLDIARHLVLPTITLSLFYLALYTRLMRASMLEQAGQDYVTSARAKGVTDFDPFYLPDGDIAFSSTREPKYNMCSPDQAANLLANLPRGPMLPPAVDVEYGGNCKARPDVATIRRELRVVARHESRRLLPGV